MKAFFPWVLFLLIIIVGCTPSQNPPAQLDTPIPKTEDKPSNPDFHVVEIYKPNSENGSGLEKVAVVTNASTMVTNNLVAGLVLYEHGSFQSALDSFNKAIDDDPDNIVLYYYRALTYNSLGNFNEAIKDANQLVKLQPEPSTYAFRAAIKSNKGDYSGSILDYDEAIRQSPKNASLYFLRADVKMASQDGDGAISDMNALIQMEPNLAKAYTYRGDYKFSGEDVEGAEEDYEKALSIDPNDALAYASRGIIRLTIHKNKEDAQKDFDKSIQIEPNEAAYTFRAIISADKKRYDEAIKDLDAAIKINPNYLNARMSRGGIRFGILEDFKGALEDYNKVIELDPNVAQYYVWRGDAKHMLGDYEGQSEDYDKAIALDPKILG